MKKMLKIMAMLLVIATVVFAAGCAEKTETTEEAPVEEADADAAPLAEDESPEAGEQNVTVEEVAVEEPAEGENPEAAPAEEVEEPVVDDEVAVADDEAAADNEIAVVDDEAAADNEIAVVDDEAAADNETKE